MFEPVSCSPGWPLTGSSCLPSQVLDYRCDSTSGLWVWILFARVSVWWVCFYVSGDLHVCACKWRPEVDIQNLPQELDSLLIKEGLLNWDQSSPVQLDCPVSLPWEFPVCSFWELEIEAASHVAIWHAHEVWRPELWSSGLHNRQPVGFLVRIVQLSQRYKSQKILNTIYKALEKVFFLSFKRKSGKSACRAFTQP